MGTPEEDVVGSMMLPQTVERPDSVPPGVYVCKRCFDQDGWDAQIPVIGRVLPGEVCQDHPENSMADLIKVGELKMPSLEIDILRLIEDLRFKTFGSSQQGES